jgi:hypothetical protein
VPEDKIDPGAQYADALHGVMDMDSNGIVLEVIAG